jgi:transcriptional regulator with XRE-family HTH domain
MKKDFNMAIGYAVKDARGHRKMSVQELADACEIGSSTLRNIESGKVGISLENAVKVSEELNIPLQALLGEYYTPPELEEANIAVLMNEHKRLCKAVKKTAGGNKQIEENLKKLLIKTCEISMTKGERV